MDSISSAIAPEHSSTKDSTEFTARAATPAQPRAGIRACIHCCVQSGCEALHPDRSSCLERPEHDAGHEHSAQHGSATAKAP